MKAALWDSINHISIVEKPMPVADEGHVVVKVKAVGVCATDVHMITGKISLATPPHVLGHEIAGVVEEIGSGVNGWKKGDRVVIDTIISCGRCKACKSGRKELCPDKQEIGYTPYDGGYAEYVRVPAQCLVHLPEEIPFRDAAIMESVACPFGAVLRVGIKPGSTVLIQGAGPAGLAFLQAAKISGAGKIIMSARGENRLELSKKFGADYTIDAKREDVLSRVMELTNGEGCDYVLEASGSEAAIMLSFDACKVGGDILCYGIPDEKAQMIFPIMKVIMKQIRLHGILEYCAGWDTLVSLVANGKINIHDMVTHTFALEDLAKAVELVTSKEKTLIKSVIEM